MDIFGCQNPPFCPSILITVSANNDPNTEPLLKYPISLEGIKPNGSSINLVQCINSDGKYYDIVKYFIVVLLFNKGMTCVLPNEDIPYSEDRGNLNAGIF